MCRLSLKMRQGTFETDSCPDLQPGSLLIDYFPILQKLPLYLQPGYRYAMKLRRREMQLHLALFGLMKDAIRQGHPLDCFGKHLIEVRAFQIAQQLWLITF